MKISKSYRINKLICEELDQIVKKLGITETSFIEMAIIEKLARIKENNDK